MSRTFTEFDDWSEADLMQIDKLVERNLQRKTCKDISSPPNNLSSRVSAIFRSGTDGHVRVQG